MPKGKGIYEDLSKKYSTRREERRKRTEAKSKDKKGNPVKPAVINNFKVNKPQNARSLNFPQVEQKLRKIGKEEGKPVVNASSDVKKFIHKPKPVTLSPLDNPTAGAIKDQSARGRSNRHKFKRKGRRDENAKTNERRTRYSE
jgi:hypothetical protein